ncbi:MAG: hypothetical protein KDA62_08280 [Planctomycetales bacterium]|nr:hypothetical protein [Planctomycetales bacterium]
MRIRDTFNSANEPTAATSADVDDRAGAWLETTLILLLLAAYAIEPTPSVNEAHYLGKAKHYWNPSWAAGDLFLESADAHVVFYWTFGWVTRFVSLPVAAWLGRLLTWSLLAWAWQRLSRAVIPRRWWSVLTAGLFVSLLHWFDMAGEWVIGGVEAKGFAYVLVLCGLRSLVQNRWSWVWPQFGAAAAFHVLTGGWSVIAAAIAWGFQRDERPSLWRQMPWLLLGGALSLPGLVPALLLTRDLPPEIVHEANRIYVFERLSHHLAFHRLDPAHVSRFAALCIAWSACAYAVRRCDRQRRLALFVAGALLIAVCGVAIDSLTANRPDLAASLLRFYWFRLSDFAVPLGTALAAAGILASSPNPFPNPSRLTRTPTPTRTFLHRARPLAIAAAILFTLATIGSVAARHLLDPRGGADVQSMPAFRRRPEWTRMVYEDWQRTTDWISQHTPPDAVFLTPRSQQTFKWNAHRAEVVNWKDMPQDAATLVEWFERMRRVYPPTTARGEWSEMSDERLRQLGREYGADYLVLDRTRHRSRPGLKRLFPLEPIDPDEPDRKSAYEVYSLAEP